MLPRSSLPVKPLPSAAQAALLALLGSSLVCFALISSSAAHSAIARTAHHRHPHASHAYVSGHLSLPHYTVLIVGYDGKVASSRSQSFRIVAPDSKVTIQLLDAHGHYAGPVVFGGSATRVITGIKAPVSLGKIDVVPRKGYAHLAHRLVRRHLDSSRWAYAVHRVPIGNGRNLGLVTSKSRSGGSGPGQDEAHVGIPNELDIAVPGTHVLKALAPATTAKSASSHAAARIASVEGEGPPPGGSNPPAGGPPPGGPPPAGEGPPPGGSTEAGLGVAAPSAKSPWMSQMFLAMNETVNDDAAGVSVAEIDSTLQKSLNLKLLGIPSTVELLELDCNGLTFCSQGGSGEAQLEGLPGTPGSTGFSTIPFPSGSLDSSNGFGEVVGPAAPNGLLGNNAGGGHEFSLNPNAISSQIGSGDVITLLASHEGKSAQIPTTIDFVFNTVPAIASWSDGAGDSGTIAYPDASNLGTHANPIKLAAGPEGDVTMTLTVYRPQRQGVAGAGEPAFMDVGHLGYSVDYASAPEPGSATIGSTRSPQCPASTYSGLSSTLTTQSTGSGEQEVATLLDSAEDKPASAADAISFTIDLTKCLVAKGVSSFSIGQPMQFDISANSQSSSDHANQTFVVERTR